MRVPTLFIICLLFAAPVQAQSLSPGDVFSLAQKMLEARLDMHNAEQEAGDNENEADTVEPEYNPADAIATSCYGDFDCKVCMKPAVDVANDAYEVLARNHAWKKWVDTEYKRMDGLASAASGLNPYAKTAYALKKSREILPAKRSFEENVKTAQTTTLESLRRAFVKIGQCEAEHLGTDNFTQIALLTWQIMKVKYVD